MTRFVRHLSLLGLAVAAALWLAPTRATAAGEATAEMFASLDKFTPGSKFRIAVVIHLADTWHINAQPASMEGLIPTTLTLETPASIVIDQIHYPTGKNVTVSWADAPVALYTGKVIIFVDAHVRDDAQIEPVRLAAALRYQACDDKVCLAPETIPLAVETEIAPATTRLQPLHPAIFDVAPAGKSSASNAIEKLVQERGWLIALVFVFFGGLALNLTPCVYPMIAITVSYFGGQGDRTMSRAFRHAFVYFLGIVVTYSTLGLIAALTGGIFGALLQSTWVLVGIAVLLVALALSMFGLYEIRPPQFLMQQATGLSSKAGYVGVFFLGAMVGIIAAPCIAPILVALLVFVGQRGDPLLGWWMFFTLAVGLGIPYVVLGTFSGLLARLPKSGTWMVWVKRVFGVLLIAVAIWITNPLWHRGGQMVSDIAWKTYAPEILQQAAAENRPVLIDFYADWCIPCKEMDKRTYADARVVAKSKEFLMLKADLTRTGTPEVENLTKQFNILGVPTTVFIGPNGHEHEKLRQIGFVKAEDFLEIMSRGQQPAAPSAAKAAPAPGSVADVPLKMLLGN